jgi:hypothetical protein
MINSAMPKKSVSSGIQNCGSVRMALAIDVEGLRNPMAPFQWANESAYPTVMTNLLIVSSACGFLVTVKYLLADVGPEFGENGPEGAFRRDGQSALHPSMASQGNPGFCVWFREAELRRRGEAGHRNSGIAGRPIEKRASSDKPTYSSAAHCSWRQGPESRKNGSGERAVAELKQPACR